MSNPVPNSSLHWPSHQEAPKNTHDRHLSSYGSLRISRPVTSRAGLRGVSLPQERARVFFDGHTLFQVKWHIIPRALKAYADQESSFPSFRLRKRVGSKTHFVHEKTVGLAHHARADKLADRNRVAEVDELLGALCGSWCTGTTAPLLFDYGTGAVTIFFPQDKHGLARKIHRLANASALELTQFY